jgi:hypothetical protein
VSPDFARCHMPVSRRHRRTGHWPLSRKRGRYDAPFRNSVNSDRVKIRPLSPVMVTLSIPCSTSPSAVSRAANLVTLSARKLPSRGLLGSACTTKGILPPGFRQLGRPTSLPRRRRSSEKPSVVVKIDHLAQITSLLFSNGPARRTLARWWAGWWQADKCRACAFSQVSSTTCNALRPIASRTW